MAETPISELRWGIVGCGLISSWFVGDLLLDRPGTPVKHVIQAVGSSSVEKASAFVSKYKVPPPPSLCSSYGGVYSDPNVDIVYIGTPHSLHVRNAIDAINAGKHVLCEKPLTINAHETQMVIAAAKAKRVYVMEGVWTRFIPLARTLQKIIHTDRTIGSISRIFVDFSLNMPIASLPSTARTAERSLGAGALLDIGIYTLTWASIILDQHPDNDTSKPPSISSTMSFNRGVDEMTSLVLNYPALSCHAILTVSMQYKSAAEFCRIEGSNGVITIGGPAASNPEFILVRENGKAERRLDFKKPGRGFYFEADQIAIDLKGGKLESDVMPLNETLRIMTIMDSIRKANGLTYPQDT